MPTTTVTFSLLLSAFASVLSAGKSVLFDIQGFTRIKYIYIYILRFLPWAFQRGFDKRMCMFADALCMA